MSLNRIMTDEEIVAKLANIEIDKNTNWSELFDLPLMYHNIVLEKFNTFINARQTTDKYAEYFESLKQASNEPSRLRSQLTLIPTEDIIPLLFYKQWHYISHMYFETFLDVICSQDYLSDSLRVVLEFIPQNILPYINITKRLLDYPDKLDLYLSMLSETGRKILFMVRDADNNSHLHDAALYNPVAFKKLLALGENDTQRAYAILAKNKLGYTVLQRAAQNDESFAVAFSYIPPTARYDVAHTEHELGKGRRLINFARTKNNMLAILNEYTVSERLDALIAKPDCDYPAIANACQNSEWLQAVLDSLPPAVWPQAMAVTGEKGRELLKSFAKQPEKMLALLSLYAEDDRLHALAPAAFLEYGPETVIAVMNLLPTTNRERPEDVIDIVNDKIQFLESTVGYSYESFLLIYAKHNLDRCIKVIDALPNDEDRLKAVKLSGNWGYELFSIAAERRMDVYEKLFRLFPEEERLAAFQETYSTGSKITELIAILLLLPPKDLQDALNLKIETYTEKRGIFNITIREALAEKPELEQKINTALAKTDSPATPQIKRTYSGLFEHKSIKAEVVYYHGKNLKPVCH